MSHQCNDLVLTCIDYRLRPLQRSLLDEIGECDRIAFAGASKAIVDIDTRASVLKQIDLSHTLHGMTTFYLVDHEDCGAYSSSATVLSEDEEFQVHASVSRSACEIIRQHFPHIRTISKYVKLNGEIVDI